MPGLDDAQRRADEMPQGGSWDTYPTLSLLDGDRAYIRFIGTGNADDVLVDSAYFHRVTLMSKKTGKPYNKDVYCPRSIDQNDGPVTPCEYHDGVHGLEASKVKLQIGCWLWVSGIHRANQNKEAMQDPNKGWGVMEVGDPPRKIFWETVNGPQVYKRGPGKGGSFMNQLKLIRDLQGGLNTTEFVIRRQGSGMEDTEYFHEPIAGTKDKAWEEAQKVIIAQLPGIQELFSGGETWPRTAKDPGANDFIDPSTLTSLTPTTPVAAPAPAVVSPEAVAAAVAAKAPAEVPPLEAPPRGGVF